MGKGTDEGPFGGTKGKVGGEKTPGVTLKQINGSGEFLLQGPSPRQVLALSSNTELRTTEPKAIRDVD